MCAYIKHSLERLPLQYASRAKIGRVKTTRIERHSHGGCPPFALGSSVRARVRYENPGYLSMVSLRSTNETRQVMMVLRSSGLRHGSKRGRDVLGWAASTLPKFVQDAWYSSRVP
jgi:hypothetical protein